MSPSSAVSAFATMSGCITVRIDPPITEARRDASRWYPHRGQIALNPACVLYRLLTIDFVKCNGQRSDPLSIRALYQTQLTLFGNPLVRFAWMLDPILELPVITLRKSRAYLISPAGSILVAGSRSIAHSSAHIEFGI